MSSQPAVDADREHRLLEQLELRIANANTDEKFESVVQKFLAALVLKVGSEHVKNRNLAIKVCQHVNNRLKLDSGIPLPLQPLFKAFRESQNAFVSRFAMMFLEQGLARLPISERPAILPEVLRGSIPNKPDIANVNTVHTKMWSIAFDFLLDALRTWRVPEHGTNEDTELRTTFQLTDTQSMILSTTLSNFITYDPKTESSWEPVEAEFTAVFKKYAKIRSQVVVAVAKFLFTSIFDDQQRFLPAILLSADANEGASAIADTMFKQCNFDLELETSVDLLYDLFNSDRPKLQTRVLTLLSRSQSSTNRAPEILRIVEQQLFRDNTGLEAAKLRSAVFQYLNWAVRVSKSLYSSKASLQTSLREFIELQGWPVMMPAPATSNELRAKAYESIGLLAGIRPVEETTEPPVPFNLITWLFTSLRCDTTRDVRASVDEALSRILNVASVESAEDLRNLKELLLWNVGAGEGDEDPIYHFRTINTTRYLTVRFTNKVLPFHDVDGRYIDILAIGSNDRREVIEEGTRGLDPYWHVTSQKISSQHEAVQSFQFPAFSEFIARVFGETHAKRPVQQQQESLSAAITFGHNLLLSEALKESTTGSDPDSDWGRKLHAMVENDSSARQRTRQYMNQANPQALIQLVENSIVGMSQGSNVCANAAHDLISLSSNTILLQLDPSMLPLLATACLNNSIQVQATKVFGIVASLSPRAPSLVDEAIASCSQWKTAIGQDMVAVQGALLCAGFTLTRMFLRQRSDTELAMVERLSTLLFDIIGETKDKSLKHAAYTVLCQMSLCLPPATTALSRLSEIQDVIISDAKKEDELAATVLGRLVGFLHAKQSDSKLLDSLYGLHEVRKAEFHFALGEALATAALGFRSTSTLSDFDIDAQIPEYGYNSELLSSILDRTISDSKTTKPSLKKACAIWLLSIIQYCDDDVAVLKDRLRECQAAFGKLLNDRDEIVQETGSRGLSLVYEKGDKSLRDDLVRDLVQSFTGGSARMSGSVDENTQLFEAGALPTESGQSVQTYKDIVSLATEMGDPSLVYRFMNLASNNAIWSSRAAFGRFGLSGILADSAYLTENKKFYPKLFRYRFDPNPNVQRSMEDIWKALVKDPNKVIEDNFDLIMTDLLKNVVSGREWRAREASCAAISDLIQGREIEKFEKYLDEIWNVAFKVLDDVKETVRVAAMKFCRTLTSMLIRNLEIGEGSSKRATTMLQHAMPFLLQQMEHGSAQEVQQYAVITLLEIVKKSPSRSLQSFAPKVLERLILSLSSLEHESINYLHLNADKYGLTAEKLDKMRVSSINSSPISEAIERCLDSVFASTAIEGNTTQPGLNEPTTTDNARQVVSPKTDAVQRLEAAFKTAIGLPSKVGLSRVIITLVVRHHVAFRPYADQFLQLTRKSILDRNATISISFSMALGYLVRLADPKEVNETSRYAQQLYFESQELAHRAVAGDIIQAISKASNDVFTNFASTFLPFAFIGRHDLDSDVRNRFDPAWQENVGGSRALHLYLSDIVGLITKHIKSSLWPIRQACCLTVAGLVSSMEGLDAYTEAEARTLWDVVEESLNGKTWDGKEKVILAFPKFVKKSRPMWAEKSKQIKTIALREAKRNNVVYRPHALTALGEVTSACPDLELGREVMEVLTNVVEQMEEHDDAMEVDGGDEQGSSARQAEATITAVVICLFQIMTRSLQPEVLDQALKLVRQTHGKISPKVDIEIYDGARRYITHTRATGGGPSSSAVGGGQGRVPAQPGLGAYQADEQKQEQEEPERERQRAAFLHGLVLALFDADDCSRRHTSDNEIVRKSRVQLAQALAGSPLLDQTDRHILATTLKSCAQGERSRPLRAELDKILSTLEA